MLSPAVKSSVRQPSRQASRQMTEEMGCPPLLDYVPYLRTDKVYQMDPLARLSRPLTHEAQRRVDAAVSKQTSPLVQHDPKSTDRREAILKGLSELRQGLLQRQRELETSLNPLQTPQTTLDPCDPKLLPKPDQSLYNWFLRTEMLLFERH